MPAALPAIPAKRYFTIGEVSELCGVKPYVLRYWEQEFAQLRPMKRRGNRRYYQHHEVLLVRRIRELLYEQGFTINGARSRLSASRLDVMQAAAEAAGAQEFEAEAGPDEAPDAGLPVATSDAAGPSGAVVDLDAEAAPLQWPRHDLPQAESTDALPVVRIRQELLLIRDLLDI